MSTAFCLSTLERYRRRRRAHELAWTLSMAMFALASLAYFLAAGLGWGPFTFRCFYLFGAILNVPYLALGTVELLAGPRHGRRWTAIVTVLGAFCAGIVVAAPLTTAISGSALPQGKEVFGPGPRIAAAVGSGVAALVIIGGALFSAWRLWRLRSASTTAPRGRVSPGRLAFANVVIAVGTLVLSAGGLLNSVVDEMDGFAISLVLGISIVFVGFLLTAPSRDVLPEPVEWRFERVDDVAA